MIPTDPVDFLFRLKTEKPLAWKKATSNGRYATFVTEVVQKLLGGESAEERWNAILAETGFGPKNAKPGRPEAVQELNEVEKLHKAGLSIATIAQRLSVSRPTVYRCLAVLGIKTKKAVREEKRKHERAAATKKLPRRRLSREELAEL